MRAGEPALSEWHSEQSEHHAKWSVPILRSAAKRASRNRAEHEAEQGRTDTRDSLAPDFVHLALGKEWPGACLRETSIAVLTEVMDALAESAHRVRSRATTTRELEQGLIPSLLRWYLDAPCFTIREGDTPPRRTCRCGRRRRKGSCVIAIVDPARHPEPDLG
jgi:hypothetical protein